VLAEILQLNDPAIGQAILEQADATRLQQLAESAGMTTCFQRALAVVKEGITSPSEVRRVFGFGH
jgi:type II secretory ATPase GspE/PulE/Tfp pilus assembly ATPase PilB-like protein